MKKSNLRATAALQALALLGAGVPVAFFAAAPAAAQDYTAGAITGTVTNGAGGYVAGATVTLRSEGQGFERTTTTGPDGNFTFSSLPAGAYDVVVQSSGTTTFRADNVEVVPGRTSDLPIGLTAAVAGEAAGAEIVVVGRRIQAFTGTTTGTTVDVEDLVKTVPLGRSLTDITLLAPGTVKGDTAFGNLASIGGGSVAENAYYINGLNITNFDNYVGSAQVPFSFYKTVEVKTGGYPAEFGRATGGIINAVSKAGTNDLIAAAHIDFAPNFLRSNARDVKFCNQPPPAGDGVCNNQTNRSEDTAESLTAVIEAGMPIIRDRLFVYGLVEFRRSESVRVNPIGLSATEDDANDPFYAVKVDAFPIDNHHLEFTYFDTRNTTIRRTRSYSEPDGDQGVVGDVTSEREFYGGGVNYVGKYTGRFTDWLTLSAAYGRYRDRFDDTGIGAGAGDAYVLNASGGTVFGTPANGFFTDQRASSRQFPYETERKFYRADADVLVNIFGEHHFRGGFDREDNTLNHTAVRTGSDQLCAAGFLSAAACNANSGGAGAALLFRPADLTGANAGVPIVEVNYFNSGGAFTSTNTAYYLQDEWKTPLDGLTLNLGVRRDDFVIKDPAGDNFVSLKKNWAPRLGFSYDTSLMGNEGQFFGSYGWYYLPIASNTAFRAVGAEYYIRERFYVTGIGPGGIPILGGNVTNNGDYQDPCALNLTGSALSTGNNCNQTGDGSPKDATYYLAKNLKPTRESEAIFGYRTKAFGMDFEVAYTHRQVDRLNEDASLDQGIVNYCEANNIQGCRDVFTGSHQFAIINPGQDVEIQVDAPGIPELNNKVITLTAEQTGYPRGKRTYDALDFSFSRPWDGLWSLGGAYTLSKSRGNSEGFVNSDIGQDDAGITVDFDFPGFTDNAYGYLPNDRRHKLKIYGAYAVIPQFILGANLRVESPRSLSCFGFNPNSALANNYGGPYNHYCNGQPEPRGTAQKTDWTTTVDLSGRYNFTVPTGQMLTLRADVFNVFNSQAVQYRDEVGDLEASNYQPVDSFGSAPTVFTPSANFGQPQSFQAPRYVRLGLDIYFGGSDVPPPPVIALAPPPPPPLVPAPATQTCADGSVILATDACPAPPPPPPPPAPAPERG